MNLNQKKHAQCRFGFISQLKKTKLAKGVLGKGGFDVDILPPGGPRDNWLCLAYKSMVPEYLEFSDFRK